MLTLAEMPGSHSHGVNAIDNGTAGGTNMPGAGVMLGSAYTQATGSVPVPMNMYGNGPPTVAMGTLAPTGGQAHENRMPSLALEYCIALVGDFPPRGGDGAETGAGLS